MSERAQALEAALDLLTRKKVEQYRVAGWQDLAYAVWGYWHDTVREVLRGQPESLAAPPVGVSPQPPVRDMGEADEYGNRICDQCGQQVQRRHRCAMEPASLSPVEPTPSREPLTGAELLDRFRPVEPTPEPPAPSGGRPTTTIEKVAREIAKHLMTNTLGERCDRLAQLYQGFPIGGGWSLDGAAELIAEVLENEGYIMDRVAEAQRRSTPVEPAPRQEGV